MDRLESLLEALMKHSLKVPATKCQLLRYELLYMANLFTIRDQRMVISSLRSRIKGSTKIPSPQCAKSVKVFVEFVYYLSIFCPNPQKLYQPTYDPTRKNHAFIWTPSATF